MSFEDTTLKFQSNRRCSTETTHWNPRESIAGKIHTKRSVDNMSPTSSITEHSAPVNALLLAQSWKQKQQSQHQQQQQEEEEEEKSNRIVEPHLLYQQGILSQDQIQELFIETCFYARLGFVQPPCCLLCTYAESLESASPNPTCSRWVIWRRNAETPLHPNQLDNNILITKCCVARSLLEGNTEDGYSWDKDNKKLVLC